MQHFVQEQAGSLSAVLKRAQGYPSVYAWLRTHVGLADMAG